MSAAPRRILEAAARLFAEKGTANTPVEMVLDEADVCRRTFYKYFRGKDDVLEGLYAMATQELVETMRAARAAQESDALAGIRFGLEAYLDFHRAGAALLRVLVVEALQPGSPLASHRRRLRSIVTEMLDDAARSLMGRGFDPFVYYALVSALEGLSLELLDIGATPADVERAKATMLALLARTFVEAGPPMPEARAAAP